MKNNKNKPRYTHFNLQLVLYSNHLKNTIFLQKTYLHLKINISILKKIYYSQSL